MGDRQVGGREMGQTDCVNIIEMPCIQDAQYHGTK